MAHHRWHTSHRRYVDVILTLIKVAGDFVSEEIWYRVVQIITNQGDALQKYATETVWKALKSEEKARSRGGLEQ